MQKQKATQILQRLFAATPNPRIELNYNSIFELLIAVILSAHATDRSVNAATATLFPIANTPSAILALGETKLKTYIKSVGLYNAKATNIIKTCEILVAQYNSQVPATREALEQLPGVGRKTANVVLNVGFGENAIGVDTHIFRVANRTKMAPGATTLAVERELLQVVAKKFLLFAHRVLVLHGRYICKAKHPLCAQCVINDLCEYADKEE